MTPGRNPSIRTSASSMILSNASTASGSFRFSATERLPRLNNAYLAKAAAASGSGTGRSMTVTSAPISASIMPAQGPGPIPAISTTLIPLSAPAVMLLPLILKALMLAPSVKRCNLQTVLRTPYPYSGLNRAYALHLPTGLTLRLRLQFGLLARASTHVILFKRWQAKSFWGRRQARPTHNNKGNRYELFRHTQ